MLVAYELANKTASSSRTVAVIAPMVRAVSRRGGTLSLSTTLCYRQNAPGSLEFYSLCKLVQPGEDHVAFEGWKGEDCPVDSCLA